MYLPSNWAWGFDAQGNPVPTDAQGNPIPPPPGAVRWTHLAQSDTPVPVDSSGNPVPLPTTPYNQGSTGGGITMKQALVGGGLVVLAAFFLSRRPEPEFHRRQLRHNPQHPRIPPLSEWHMHAGGTSATRDKHGYTYRTGTGSIEYHIDPISSRHNVERHVGYVLRVFGAPPHYGWATIDANGISHGSHVDITFRSAASAAVAARKHFASLA